ncbi:putative DNA polymerase epsilon catalytic subunit [Leptomonas pyrrhocoris]|uniref:DNA polymerase epsilon catalytic subunit n=1 Tax=Leptomonas pyrrhocoris TaxID=157538 RepID=A0A0M9GAU7_LEPPY|nr:putative DNA polymerase epsilon catalytic subunit [Leptomonas pyrrhocoris]KPA86530.1 putative DNA polymerase epsilon catalytic subunit [Leptomonas pyrrhocoris]|eukprot:XP_015664969.1 putative DNA polymerase epsilon catalytic subunit [Leptomonas pyrrhocoris]
MSTRLESGTKEGWLFNYYPTSETVREEDGVSGEGAQRAALVLLFQDLAGDTFYVHLHYNPYILVQAVEGHEREVELGLMSVFGPQLIHEITPIEKEDLDLINHLSGRKRVYLKVVFRNVQDLTTVRGRLEKEVQRNSSRATDVSLQNLFSGSLGDAMAKTFEEDALESAANGGGRWMDWIQDIREYDVKYHMRVAIDMKVYVGLWYDVTVVEGEASVRRCDDSRYAPAMPRVVAFDIETTKAPLRFPQPEVDQIYMISYMLDGRGYLIINREIVTEDIAPFEYTPKPEYEGFFDTFNEDDEAATLRRFFDEMNKYQPNVYVTYNGDYFDFPFIHARALYHGMNMRKEIGFTQMADGAFLNQQIPHLDCFYWVKRDSYLPQGSQGLKAVTKYKLGYEPIEVDPENMLPLAQSHPQRMASYSVSDAVSTWYLYQKYVHPFIFSLATIIPMSPDDVLRKGSGGLCESLLMVQAEANNVVFPNKKELVRERFYEGHLIDMETYIGGRVEALRSGVYRSDIPMTFNMNPDTYQNLMDDVDNALRFCVEVENGVKMEEVTNLEEIKTGILTKLAALRDHPHQQEKPFIYHLDVGAMYPNIILTNRLQPYAIARPDVCAGCCYNSPNNELQCKRVMSWKWRAELFTAGRYEFQRVKAQLENESFAAGVIEQANLAAVQKKAYGNRKGNVLEGTAYERKDDWKKNGSSNNNNNRNNGIGGGRFNASSGGSGYRQESRHQQREAADALLRREFGGGNNGDNGSDDDDNDEDGPKAFHKLNDSTQFNMLKRRLSEYSRKAYGRIHETREVMRSNVVCQRENSFYVDTVRLFRDRRYEYKAALKTWKKKLDAATDVDTRKVCQSRCVQMESLQLAHKCILNSFYGYVMRKGSRWSSMEMAGIVTYLGATLIQMARSLVQQIGVPLELDTDGIWCCLPNTFPENYTIKTSNASKSKISLSYPCVVLNKMVHDRYSNPQYQNLVSPGVYETHNECSIYFEVDGPYLAMLLPASREEGKSIKKRYAVFNPDGSMAELKGFELKRRGELMLVKDFQAQVFRRFLDGTTLAEAYASAAYVANTALDLLESKGDGYDPEEILEKITESSNMSRRLSEYPEAQKSLAITTARRIAEFLGPQMVKDKGLACHFIISRMPAGRPVTERAIPVTIFRAEPAIRTHFLRKWTGDTTLPSELNLKALLDWDYYTARFSACVQKIVSIPAALQSLPNPVPRVVHPDWLEKRIRHLNSRYRQVSLVGMLAKAKTRNEEERQGATASAGAAAVVVTATSENELHIEGDDDVTVVKGIRKSNGGGGGRELQDLEDMMSPGAGRAPKPKGPTKPKLNCARAQNAATVDGDSDDDDDAAVEVESEDDVERQQRVADAELDSLAHDVKQKYFAPKSTVALDAGFFAEAGSKRWLAQRRDAWLQRARLRKELALENGFGDVSLDGEASGAAATVVSGLNSHFIDLKSRALATTWNVMEVRETDEDPGVVQVLAALDQNLYSFRVQVQRTVLVDVDPTLRLHGFEAVELNGRVLPRHVVAGRLYQVAITPGEEGERRLNELRMMEGVRQIYEQHRSRTELFIEQLGCCASVDAGRHLRNARRRPPSQREMFGLEEMEMNSYSNYLGRGVADRTVFIFQAVTEQQRGLIAVVYPQTSSALVVFIQPAEAPKPSINWTTVCEEGARRLRTDPPAPIHVTAETAVDQRGAWRLIYQHLSAALESTRAPLLAVLQSSQPTAILLQQHALPTGLPYLRVLGAAEDERLLSDPFRWARLLSKRLFERFFASLLWVEERLALSRMSGIPLCNIAQDSCVHVLDVLYTRALHRRSHVLWCSSDAAVAFDTVEERPRAVCMAGGYPAWCVDFSLSRLDVVALLFSQVIEEGDDPNARVLCDRGVSTHFNILRDLVADLLGQAVENTLADTLMNNVARWLRDPVSVCYEPRLVEMLSGLAHRALTGVLLRLAKLGGRTVKVDGESVTVLTAKHSIQEAVSFANFVATSLQDQPMLMLLALQPVRYWCPYVVLDPRNYAGLYVSTEAAVRIREGESPSRADLQLSHQFTMTSRLPSRVRAIFVDRVVDTLFKLHAAIQAVYEDTVKDHTVTLATRHDHLARRLLQRSQALCEGDLQTAIMDEVQRVADTRDLYTVEEDAARQNGSLTFWSSSAVALEYAKCICRVLELIPSNGAVGTVRNNCMRLCGISPFSPLAQFQSDPFLTYRLQSLTCSFCCSHISIDLLAKRKAPTAPFTCSECEAPIAASAVEGSLVRHVSQLLRAYNQQDFVCSKCHEMTTTYVAEGCCGPLVGKAARIEGELRALQYLAKNQGFAWLMESVEAALLCS